MASPRTWDAYLVFANELAKTSNTPSHVERVVSLVSTNPQFADQFSHVWRVDKTSVVIPDTGYS